MRYFSGIVDATVLEFRRSGDRAAPCALRCGKVDAGIVGIVETEIRDRPRSASRVTLKSKLTGGIAADPFELGPIECALRCRRTINIARLGVACPLEANVSSKKNDFGLGRKRIRQSGIGA